MAREITRTVKTVERLVGEESRKCDKCKRSITTDPGIFLADQSRAAQELYIMLNPEECMSTVFRRDYCPHCLGPIWQAICKLIGGDPEFEGRDYDDDDD